MKLKKHLQRLLLLAGILLLTFYGAAKLHEVILSRSAMRGFEAAREAKLSESSEESFVAQPVASPPDFASWSEKRIGHYEESFGQHLAAPLAVIRIARINVEAPVLEGTNDLTLNRGVGHIPGTAFFEKIGNVGIAGHRDGFFRGLKDIEVGDRIEVEEPDKIRNLYRRSPADRGPEECERLAFERRAHTDSRYLLSVLLHWQSSTTLHRSRRPRRFGIADSGKQSAEISRSRFFMSRPLVVSMK